MGYKAAVAVLQSTQLQTFAIASAVYDRGFTHPTSSGVGVLPHRGNAHLLELIGQNPTHFSFAPFTVQQSLVFLKA